MLSGSRKEAALFWTLLASAAYCSYLYPAMEEYELTPEALPYLALRIMFFFLAAMVVNRFARQSQQQTRLYRELAERLVPDGGLDARGEVPPGVSW